MAYSGSTPEQRRLFIGHAKAGYCVWRSPHDYRRTPYVKGGPVCSIGSATMATDGSFIVIITLDHSTVVYPVDHDGPKLNEGRVYANHEQAGYRPIIPVTLAANRMVLKGSTSGQVPIMDLLNGPLAPIGNISNNVIRVLTGYGDKVVVGLSDTSGRSSQIICYLDVAVSVSDFIHSDDDHPVFEVTISELEETGCFNKMDGQDGAIARWPGGIQSEPRSINENVSEKSMSVTWNPLPAVSLGSLLLPLARGLLAIMRYRRTWTTIGVLWVFITILVVDPPNLPVMNDRKSTSSRWEHDGGLHPIFSDSTNLVYVGVDKSAGLGVLLLFLGSYVVTRLMWWGTWGIALVLMLLGLIFKTTVYVLLVPPQLIRYTMTNLPAFLYNTLCDALDGYDVPVCPARA
ncbi:hypothetical protein FRC11_001360 [Ceratobasidium sp. 423]|nr:hypothetical protein FRC11_001360 [Ceratobasidium sp. 423]